MTGGPDSTDFDAQMIALVGPRNHDATYNWRTGGCFGPALHAAGIPGAE